MLWLKNIYRRVLARALEMAGCGIQALPISAASLASLSDRAGENLILVDLRETHEIENRSFSIPGALITVNVSLPALIRWVPQGSTVVIFAAEAIPPLDRRLRVPAKKLKLYALDGGLQSWSNMGLPLEPVTLTDRRWVDNR
jgi:rhodanese-related sulfurtransferase